MTAFFFYFKIIVVIEMKKKLISEKMLVTQALDERDLLVKKISDKIDKRR